MNPTTYVYFYYYTDSLLNVLMFWVIIKFYQETFAEMGVSQYIRAAAVMLILLTAVFSYAVVHQNRTHLTSHFVVEIEPECLLRRRGADVPALGRHIEVARNPNAADPVGAGAGDLLQRRRRCTYALRNLFPGLEAESFCAGFHR